MSSGATKRYRCRRCQAVFSVPAGTPPDRLACTNCGYTERPPAGPPSTASLPSNRPRPGMITPPSPKSLPPMPPVQPPPPPPAAVAPTVPINAPSGVAPGAAMPASALIGQFIGNYKIVKELGSGAMGAVYKAEDTALGRVVAIKYLTSSRPNSRERFKREARVIGKLSHPNIVQVYNFGDHLGVPYLVVEFMAGGSLEDRVSKGGPIPWQEACHHIADAARGLAAAHREKIVHRDLKPANLLADEDGHVKVADFGLARETDDPSKLTKTGLLVGTPAYIAPEFCMGKPAGPLSDMYSLGCTLYFLLTGRLAFEAPDIVRVIRMHMTQEFPDPRKVFPEIPGEVTAILRRCCAKDPAQRFADCDEMADALEHAVHATATQTDIPVGAGLDAGLAGDFAGGPPPDAGDDPLGAAPFRRPGPGPGMTARQPPPDDGYYGPEDGDGLPARRGSDAAAMFWIIGGSVLLGIAFIVFVLLIRK